MGLLVGFLFGLVLSFAATINVFEEDINTGYKSNKLIEECQKDLRRDEYCTIIAVPTDEVEED